MDKSFNFQLSKDKPLSKLCVSKSLNTFLATYNYVHQLNYGRTIDRSDFTSIITEGKGTCSTKHAFLKQIAIENNFDKLSLWIGIYKRNANNTKSIGNVLKTYDLDYIPEAHCYLKFGHQRYDITFPESKSLKFEDSLLTETEIDPVQIGDFKLKMHKDYLRDWIKSSNYDYSFDEIWNIREACIMALQNV